MRTNRLGSDPLERAVLFVRYLNMERTNVRITQIVIISVSIVRRLVMVPTLAGLNRDTSLNEERLLMEIGTKWYSSKVATNNLLQKTTHPQARMSVVKMDSMFSWMMRKRKRSLWRSKETPIGKCYRRIHELNRLVRCQ